MIDNISVKGYLHVVHEKADGSVQEYDFPNLVVTTGKTYIASRMSSASTSVIGWIAVGSGSTAPTGNQRPSTSATTTNPTPDQSAQSTPKSYKNPR